MPDTVATPETDGSLVEGQPSQRLRALALQRQICAAREAVLMAQLDIAIAVQTEDALEHVQKMLAVRTGLATTLAHLTACQVLVLTEPA
jgi:hypothetical protein